MRFDLLFLESGNGGVQLLKEHQEEYLCVFDVMQRLLSRRRLYVSLRNLSYCFEF